MHSIRIKIIAVTMAAVLTGILALGIIGVISIGVESDRSSVEKLSLISENMQERLDAYLESIKQSVDMAIHMAEDSLTMLNMNLLSNTKTAEESEQLDTILTNHCAEVEHAFSSIANNTSGIVTYYYCINSDLGSSEHGFFWSNLNEKEFVEQPPLISTDLDINDIEHTTWYFSPLKAGRPVWVGPYKAHYLGERLTISYVAPIYKFGFLIGVLGMDILYDTIISLVKDLKVYETGFVFLLDKDNTILYHPFMEMGSETIAIFQEQNADIFKRRSSKDEMIRYYAVGEERQLAFSTLSNNTKVAVTAPVNEINASQRQLSRLIVLVAALIIGIFTIVILIVIDAITKPLLRLAEASQRLADGDYTIDLNYQGKDEVAILTKSFKQMRNKLRLYISDLNSRAYSDALTGVCNKGAYDIYTNSINEKIQSEGKENSPEFAIILFDCNSLKKMNDENGHLRGDIYLQSASALLLRVFSQSPVFRIGGDEFAVILQHDSYNNRKALLETFERSVEEHNSSITQPWEKVDLSKGMAEFHPESDQNVEQVLRRADELMYADKRRSKSSQD